MLKKERDIQIQEAQRIPNKVKPKRPTLRHIIIKMSKVKEENLKSSKRKITCYIQRNPHKIIKRFFSAEILQARRERHNIVAVVKERKIQPRILHPAKLLLRIEGENSFPNKQKLKEFITTKPAS